MSPVAKLNDEYVVDERKSAILKVVVDSYISEPTPVASKTVTQRSGLDVSPATIRNDMHALEVAGYLAHTHTSSGRIPTDRGYRFFVDNFVSPEPNNAKNKGIFETLGASYEANSDRLLEHAVVLLSSLTQHTAVIIKDSSKTAKVCDIHLSQLADGRIVVALILDDSSLERIVLDRKDECANDELALYSEKMRAHFCGHVVRDVLRSNTESQNASDVFINEVIDALDREEKLRPSEGTVHVAGVANVAKSTTNKDGEHQEISAQLLSLVEQQMVLLELIRNSVNDTIGAHIGSENVCSELSRHSMVLAPFATEAGERGAVGVIGPTRMNYNSVFAYLNSVSASIPKFLD